MGQEKERLIEEQWQQQQRQRKEQADNGYIPPIRPPEFDRDDD
jgi:hypothetical protein